MKILLSKLIDLILICVIVVPACFSVYLLVSEYAAYILAAAILIPFAVLKAFSPFRNKGKETGRAIYMPGTINDIAYYTND
jgi:hypothetical protein